ncbi:MAG: DUF2911 domain-containing protein [Bacteroidota bacterium]|jgi:hypothetical protein
MKRVLLFGLLLSTTLLTEAQLKTPAPSPAQSLRQDFGLGNIEISYSRPGVRGRKIFGDVVPFGQVWRTGANNATTIAFTDEVIIGGKKLAPGKYGLLTIPGSKEWVVIISKQTNVTSPADYKADQDLVRVNAAAAKSKTATETFTISLQDIKNTSCNLVISWDKRQITVPIQTEIEAKIMANIEAAMKTEKPPYYNAAMYYMDNGKDLNQALSWFDKAVEANPTAFWIHYQRANCLAKLGKKAEAIAGAEKSKQLATEAKNGDYVKLNEKLIAELNK